MDGRSDIPRRRISRRILYKGPAKFKRRTTSKSLIHDENQSEKGKESEVGTIQEEARPLHLRFEEGKTYVLCKSGSFNIDVPNFFNQGSSSGTSPIASSYLPQSPPPSSVESDHERKTTCKKWDQDNEELNRNSLNGSRISDLSKKNGRNPKRIKNNKIKKNNPPPRNTRRNPVRKDKMKDYEETDEVSIISSRLENSTENSKNTSFSLTRSMSRNKGRYKRRSATSFNGIEQGRQSCANLANEKTWADKTAESQGAQCNAIQVRMIDLIRTIRRKCDGNGFFSAPVDPVEDECPDYFDVIDKDTEAMDLKTMETFIRDGSLKDMKDFEFFINRIYTCAIKYNSDPENFVRQKAEEFRELSKPLIEQTRIRIDKMNGRRKSSLSNDEDKERKIIGNQENNLVERRKQPKRIKQKRTTEDEAIEEREDSSVFSMSSKADSELESIETSSNKRRLRNKRYSRHTRNASRKDDNTPERRQTRKRNRKRNRKSLYVDDSSDGESSTASFIEGADIPFCLKDVSNSESRSCCSRKEWISLCPQLVTVCNEAARRATLRSNPTADRFDKPLSETYIKERLELGFPLRGHTIWMKPNKKRGPVGLQGFVVTTNFISWKKSLRFCMYSPAAGLTPKDKYIHTWDDGSITQYLQQTLRSGEISNKGIVYNRVAEIALLGGLGCGSFLLCKALHDLEESGEYDVVVLQATKNAIPFYQKHGFVRIGAVARFNDEVTMPEIAYRHWSEIVDGEVVEASYMMALRIPPKSKLPSLSKFGIKSFSASTEKVQNLKHEEVASSLLSAKKLLEEAIYLKMSSSSGGRPTFYELLAIAREFGASANDFNMVATIDRATKQSVGYTIRHSKSILRSSLNFTFDKKNLDEAPRRLEMRPITVKIIVEDKDFSELGINSLQADILTSKKTESKSMFHTVVVRIVCDGDNDMQEEVPLQAIIPVPERTNCREVKEASELAFHDIRKLAYTAMMGTFSRSWEELLSPNDFFMIQVGATDGSPLWMSAFIDRKCRRSEVPKGNDIRNTYFVHLSDGETIRETLDRSCQDFQRGVGRKWCTSRDWGGFSALPIFILDLILIGASVKYTDLDGHYTEGYITNRVGGGLHSEPKWRVKLQNENRDTRSSTSTSPVSLYKDLEAGALRDIIMLDDAKIKEVMTAIVSMGPVPQSPGNLISTFAWKDASDGYENEPINSADEEDMNEGDQTNISETKQNELKSEENEMDDWVAQRMKNQMLGKWYNGHLSFDAETQSDSQRSRKHFDRVRKIKSDETEK